MNRRWFLHGTRPNGAQCWHPFETWADFVRVVETLCAAAPPDTTWRCTRSNRSEET